MKKSLLSKEYKALLKTIYNLRMSKGFTQLELAEKLTLPQSMISKIENGDRRIDIVELKWLVEVMDCDLVDFIKEFKNNCDDTQ